MNVETLENFKINNWDIDFDSSFDTFSLEQKYLLLIKVENKYLDFNDIILRLSKKIEENFNWVSQHNIYSCGCPCKVHIKHLGLGNNIKFTIVVMEEGPHCNSSYTGAEKLNVSLL